MNMLKKQLAALAIVAILPASAMALGVGLYGEFNRGYEGYGGNLGGDFRGTNEYNGGTGGIIVDTAVAKDQMLGYRFRLGAGMVTLGTNSFVDIGMVHTLCVSPARLRSDMVRFWFGPRIGIHYLFTEIIERQDTSQLLGAATSGSFDTSMLLPLILFMSVESSVKLDILRLDLGMVLAGFNFNFGEYFTLSIELGFDYGYRIGRVKSESLKGNAFGEGIEGYGAMSMMFRINDTYAPSGKAPKMTIKVE